MSGEHRGMGDDEVAAAVAAGAAQQAPDDAPECHERGCSRLGVIAQSVTASSGGTRWLHWCLAHDPEAVAVGKLMLGTEFTSLAGVTGPGWHVVEVIRDGGPRDGDRMGWAAVLLSGGGLEMRGPYNTLQEASAAVPPA